MASEPTTVEWLQSLMEPGVLLAYAMSSYAKVSLEAVFRHGQILAPILQTGRLRDEAFARFWISFTVPQEGEETPQPAQEQQQQQQDAGAGTVKASADLIPPILSRASGTVLDIGPGSGVQMPLLRAAAANIKKVYGAEPCLGLHKDLRAAALREGLESKYNIMPCSAAASELVPALEKEDVLSADKDTDPTSLRSLRETGGVFDTIICIRVLCSVPDLERTVSELYALLKPGGKMLITEHVVNPWRSSKGSIIARLLQSLYQVFGWSWFLGDCCLTRDTGDVLRRVADGDGGWESFELEGSFGRVPLSYVSGVLVKRSSA